MSVFDHEIADETLTERIATYLDGQEETRAVAFIRVLDDAIYAEDWAKLHGQYPPLGHGYPRQGR